MNVIPLLVVCSLALSFAGVLLFLYSTRHRDHEHAERLSLLPLEEDLEPSEEQSADCERTARGTSWSAEATRTRT